MNPLLNHRNSYRSAWVKYVTQQKEQGSISNYIRSIIGLRSSDSKEFNSSLFRNLDAIFRQGLGFHESCIDNKIARHYFLARTNNDTTKAEYIARLYNALIFFEGQNPEEEKRNLVEEMVELLVQNPNSETLTNQIFTLLTKSKSKSALIEDFIRVIKQTSNTAKIKLFFAMLENQIVSKGFGPNYAPLLEKLVQQDIEDEQLFHIAEAVKKFSEAKRNANCFLEIVFQNIPMIKGSKSIDFITGLFINNDLVYENVIKAKIEAALLNTDLQGQLLKRGVQSNKLSRTLIELEAYELKYLDELLFLTETSKDNEQHSYQEEFFEYFSRTLNLYKTLNSININKIEEFFKVLALNSIPINELKHFAEAFYIKPVEDRSFVQQIDRDSLIRILEIFIQLKIKPEAFSYCMDLMKTILPIIKAYPDGDPLKKVLMTLKRLTDLGNEKQLEYISTTVRKEIESKKNPFMAISLLLSSDYCIRNQNPFSAILMFEKINYFKPGLDHDFIKQYFINLYEFGKPDFYQLNASEQLSLKIVEKYLEYLPSQRERFKQHSDSNQSTSTVLLAELYNKGHDVNLVINMLVGVLNDTSISHEDLEILYSSLEKAQRKKIKLEDVISVFAKYISSPEKTYLKELITNINELPDGDNLKVSELRHRFYSEFRKTLDYNSETVREFGNEIYGGPSPWDIDPIGSEQSFLQSHEVISKAVSQSASFNTMTHFARRIGNREPLLFAFLKSLGKSEIIRPANSSWLRAEFPGNGFKVEDLELDDIIKRDLTITTAFQPITINKVDLGQKDLLKRSQEITNDLLNSRIYIFRGCIIIRPNSTSYSLASSSHPEGENYGYIIYNDHLKNPSLTHALLVPTRIIDDSLNGKLETLQSSFLLNNPDVLNLTRLSNHTAGLSTSRRPGSKPIFDWKRKKEDPANQPSIGSMKDIEGHIHISDGYFFDHDTINLHQEEMLKVYQDDHLRIYDLANKFQNMFDKLIVLSSWFYKGTLIDKSNGANQDYEYDDDDFRVLDFDSNEILPEAPAIFGGDLMLRAIESWHEEFQRTKQKSSIPLLMDYRTLDYSLLPDWRICIDPTDMTYITRNEAGQITEKQALPSNLEQLEFFWTQQALARVQDDYSIANGFKTFGLFNREILEQHPH